VEFWSFHPNFQINLDSESECKENLSRLRRMMSDTPSQRPDIHGDHPVGLEMTALTGLVFSGLGVDLTRAVVVFCKQGCSNPVTDK
jgi:hypothetical protein